MNSIDHSSRASACRRNQWIATPEIHASELERQAKMLRERAEAMEQEAAMQRFLAKIR